MINCNLILHLSKLPAMFVATDTGYINNTIKVNSCINLEIWDTELIKYYILLSYALINNTNLEGCSVAKT